MVFSSFVKKQNIIIIIYKAFMSQRNYFCIVG